MYSKEDRERILADWAESGLPLATFCRQPGKPARQSLLCWQRQAEAGLLDVPERRVRGRAEREKHSRYSKTTIAEALALLGRGMRPSDVARRLGVSSGSVVASWKRKSETARMAPKEAPMDKRGKAASAAEMQERIDELELQVAVLKEIVRDPKAAGPERLSNRQKAELGERLRRELGFSLKELLRALQISKSTYEYQRAAMRAGEPGREERAAAVGERVRHAFEASGRTYGYRRVRASILSGGDGLEAMRVSEAEVRSAMRKGGMVARRTRRKGWSSYAGEPDERPGNLPLRDDGTHDFHADEPGAMFVTDVTEFKAGGAKVYLSPFVDCFDGMPAAWAMSLHPDSRMCNASLVDALASLPEGAAPTVHTDGGAVYRARSWKAICEEHGVRRSMSRKGCCPDNARAEGFFGALKEEFYNGRDWSRCPPERFMEELDAYIVWYRDGRLKAFRDECGRVVYDTISGRRAKLGHAA